MGPERYGQRVDRLREELARYQLDGMVLIVEEGLNWESVFYLSGFRGSSSAVLITPYEAFLITDGRYLEQAAEQTGFTLVPQGNGSLVHSLDTLVRKKKIGYLGFEGNRVFYTLFKALEGMGLQLRDLSGLVPSLRRNKDEDEVLLIEKAASIASEAFIRTLGSAGEDMSEMELANILEFNVRSLGAEGGWPDHGFVVVSGLRSSLPHGVPTSKKLGRGEWITVDFGATFGGYVSDITRNLVIGEADPKGLELHALLAEAHLKAASALAPGIRCRDIDMIARQVIEDAGYGEYFSHGLGHGIGLEVHEKPRLSSTSDDILQPGDVVTVEPGIYLPEKGGMRLEDDYLIIPGGSRRITSELDQVLFQL